MESVKSLKEKLLPEIKEELLTYCESKGMDFKNALEIEFRKATHYINEIVLKSERALMNEQANDLPNELRIVMLERTFFQLRIIQEQMIKQNEMIKSQELEIQTMKDKFDFFKKDYRK